MVAGANDIRAARYDKARVAGFVEKHCPDDPLAFFRPDALRHRVETFRRGFPGAVSYAVKANPLPVVLDTLANQGVTTFDVASVAEMRAARAACPHARLHYHNPIRSKAEIAAAKALGVASWSVDRMSELKKLGQVPRGAEVAIRLSLHRDGGAYDFGTKFGAPPEKSVALLKEAAARGMATSLTFHPGTQCTDPGAWADYIAACADIVARADVPLTSLNVGGGFPSCGGSANTALGNIFAAIRTAVAQSFPGNRPKLWCEPGRAMVSDAMWLLLKVKARSGTMLFLNDGLYGALGEWRDMPVPGQITALSPSGNTRGGQTQEFTIFGPTCDSLDKVPGAWALPSDLQEDDYLLIQSAGAYSLALVTGFNGYGTTRVIDLSSAPIALDSAA